MERIKTFDELTIRDNFLFQHVMRNEQLCTHLIEKIVGDQSPLPALPGLRKDRQPPAGRQKHPS